ncbi:protein-methionine-sulfoxide reductase catalytic subunit MsrP [Actibacterium pelagium]|uniref:Protein-methionine-sulfoxide reductase catalytic subunit MsrP n=1 Tax=Actibacterium pelagium TaxID=2029103 RepID=A0A917ALW5_9RHOB|nr:protein-methionine-sulfoxide reductase catalytic subunit MsrP [Actibacterium pelagium]GGE59667.1 protein-methionine-sulfoxide reductase catalytic subunit MsrP [Actibacterium pelagium]
MRRARATDPKWSDVTPKEVFLNRRQLIAGASAVAGAAAFGSIASPAMAGLGAKPSRYSTNETPNAKSDITSYCNFYEFGTGKDDPAKYAAALTIDPWSIQIGGMVDKPGTYDLDDLTKGVSLEERIYRFRCVEAWSMVVPWVGFELKTLLDRVGVQPSAKYVAFETLERPSEMRGQRSPVLDWPYREGLRLDEAMHPLTIMATGLYDEPMPKQNGAPIRLVVPWKYGFKSIKSIVKITLTDREPQTSWNMANGREYGFYSNVNPEVDHPRWSQATERVLGAGLFAKRVPTRMFNGYGDEVAGLYEGMDLRKNY